MAESLPIAVTILYPIVQRDDRLLHVSTGVAGANFVGHAGDKSSHRDLRDRRKESLFVMPLDLFSYANMTYQPMKLYDEHTVGLAVDYAFNNL